MFRRTTILLCGAIVLVSLCCSRRVSQTITIDPNGSGRVFEGLGAISAGASTRLLIDYPEPYRSQILDLLFKPNYGASLQHLKVEIGGDVNSTDGSEPSIAHTRAEMSHPDFNRGYEWWLMLEAKKRNPAIMLDALAWGAPGWVGNGKFYSQDMADYVAKFLQGAKDVHHMDIAYTGVWNEKRYEVPYIKLLKKTLLAHKLPTKIVCCDLLPHEDPWAIFPQMQEDPELRAAVDVIGLHYMAIDTKGTGPFRTPQIALDSGKPLWASEDHPPRPIWRDPKKDDWPRASQLARLYNENYIERRFTKTEPWALITSYYDILAAPNSGLMYASTPWSGNYHLQYTIWATAHTSQFAQPGWQYIDSACGYLKSKGSYVTLKSPKAAPTDYSIIAETIDAAEPQVVTFQPGAGLSQGKVHVWRTNPAAGRIFEHVAAITPRDGVFSITLEPGSIYSLTTTTGQTKGAASPATDAPFPVPYTDDFESTPRGRSPRYLSDQNGSFEVMSCTGRPGNCLQQVVDRKPITWGPTPDPYTLLGSNDLADYQVGSDVLLEDKGEVSVMGRMDDTGRFRRETAQASWVSAYVLVLRSDSSWELLNTSAKASPEKLGSGKLSAPPGKWHNLALKFKGTGIQALIDGAPVASVNSAAHKAGLAAIGCGWHKAQFDNFKLER